jgi:hypothetical protein
MPHIITEEQSLASDSNIISINLKNPRMSHCEPLYMAPTRAYEKKTQKEAPPAAKKVERPRSTGY